VKARLDFPQLPSGQRPEEEKQLPLLQSKN
jgi:hypothetical protein